METKVRRRKRIELPTIQQQQGCNFEGYDAEPISRQTTDSFDPNAVAA